jgi:hypothetical protein
MMMMMAVMMDCSLCRNNRTGQNCECDNRKHNPTNLHVKPPGNLLLKARTPTCGLITEAYRFNPPWQVKVFLFYQENNI